MATRTTTSLVRVWAWSEVRYDRAGIYAAGARRFYVLYPLPHPFLQLLTTLLFQPILLFISVLVCFVVWPPLAPCLAWIPGIGPLLVGPAAVLAFTAGPRGVLTRRLEHVREDGRIKAAMRAPLHRVPLPVSAGHTPARCRGGGGSATDSRAHSFWHGAAQGRCNQCSCSLAAPAGGPAVCCR